jgi:hypothetical protein
MARVASISKFDGISHADAILTSVHYRVAGAARFRHPNHSLGFPATYSR